MRDCFRGRRPLLPRIIFVKTISNSLCFVSIKNQALFTNTGLFLNSLSKMIFLENRAKILYLLFENLCNFYGKRYYEACFDKTIELYRDSCVAVDSPNSAVHIVGPGRSDPGAGSRK